MKILILKSRENLTKFIFKGVESAGDVDQLSLKEDLTKKVQTELESFSSELADGISKDECITLINQEPNKIVDEQRQHSVKTIGIQGGLKHLGYFNGSIDGIFSEETKNALINFQRNSKLAPDGDFGPKSTKAIISALKSGSVNINKITSSTVFDKYNSSKLNKGSILAKLKQGEYKMDKKAQKNFLIYADKILHSISKYSKKYGVPEKVALGWIYLESKFDPLAKSGFTTAKGLTQILDGTKGDIVRSLGYNINRFDIDQSIDGGMKYLGDQIKRVRKSNKTISERGIIATALAAYHGGYGKRNGHEHKKYAEKVLKHADKLT
jgi:peptidoglycan hydrolase-like protein with peptidoglycan-binding domain